MKNKLYRSVSCSDRVPKKDGVYIVQTKLGLIKTACFKNGNFVATKIGGDGVKITDIEWWLEEIELPSEDDISTKARIIGNGNAIQRKFFNRGASFILNQIKV